MNKKIISLILCSALGLSCLAGCSDSEGDDKTGEGTSNAGTIADGEKVTVNFSNFFVEGQGYHDLTEAAVEKFNSENKNMEIVLEEMPSDPYLIHINSLGTTGDLPELVMINGSMMSSFSDTGVIIPLTDIVKNSGIEEKMKPGIFDECTNQNDGEIYSIPIAAGRYGFIMYNTEIFKEAGVDSFPTNLDEFKVACDKIKAAGYIPMALGDKALWPGDSLLFSSFVNNFVGNEWYSNIRKNNGESSFTDQVFIDALTAFQKLAKDGTFNDDFVSIDNDERQSLYTNGKAAMISAGDWECIGVQNNNPDIANVTKVVAWPGPAENAKASGSIEQSAAWGFAMSAKITDAQKEVATKFLTEYVITEDWARDLTEINNAFPAWNGDYDASKLSTPAVSLREAIETGSPCLNWDATLSSSVKEVYQRGLQELLINQITPEKLAKDMQEEYEMAN